MTCGRCLKAPPQVRSATGTEGFATATYPPIHLEPGSLTPLYQQIEMQVRAAIAARLVAPGDRLPSVRQLASDLGVARITVITAYDELIADGLLTGRVGAGTFVTAPEHWAAARAHIPRSILGDHREPRRVIDLRANRSLRVGRSLDGGRLLRQAWHELEGEDLLDHSGQDLRLERALAVHLAGRRGFDFRRAALVLVQSRAAALELLLDAAALKHGSFDLTSEELVDPLAAAALGGTARSVSPRPRNELAEATHRRGRHQVTYIATSAAYPSGEPLGMEARHLLAASGVELIIEDDRAAELRLMGYPLPPIQQIRNGVGVAAVGQLECFGGPLAAYSFIVVPPELAGEVKTMAWERRLMPSRVDQRAMALALESGGYVRAINAARHELRRRLESNGPLMRRAFPGRVVGVPTGGPWLTVDSHCSAAAGATRSAAAEGGVLLSEIRPLCSSTASSMLAFNYGAVTEERFAEAIGRIAIRRRQPHALGA